MSHPILMAERESCATDADRDLRRELEALRSSTADERAAGDARLAAALEERDRAVATLESRANALASLSHELRTPMNGILGMTRIVLATELSAEQRDCLEVVSASADQLLTLINDILDLSKLGAGRLELETIPFDLRDTVRTTAKSLDALATDKGLELETTVADDVPVTLLGDPTRLRQVLLNLLANALKFTDGGRVGLSVEVKTPISEDVELLFRVADEGIGIPAERIDSLFEPYSQVATSTSRRYGGTGLGLAICRELVDLMQGRIWVESVEGEGSDFFFTALFGVGATRAGGTLALPRAPSGSVAYVLTAEASARDLARRIGQTGLQPSLFDRSEAFLEAVGEEAPDVAIIDLDHFPLAVVAKLDPALRTIVVTSSGQRGDAARCHASGAAAYLTRPLDRLDLRDAVRAVLGGHGDALVTRHWLRERRSRLRVLAADDNSANRLVLARMLESEGHEVVTVADGREAVAAIQAGPFDIVLMDLDMPEMDGLEATRVLRQSGIEVPVIALTGHLSPERIEACQAAGMTGHLGKPIRLDELIDAVEATITAVLPAPVDADRASS